MKQVGALKALKLDVNKKTKNYLKEFLLKIWELIKVKIKIWGEKIKRKDLKQNKKINIWFSAIWNNKIFWWRYLYIQKLNVFIKNMTRKRVENSTS